MIVEYVISTGKSLFESLKVIEDHGGKFVALSSIVNRSKKSEINNLPIISAVNIEVEAWEADDLPEELKKIPAVKHGSRKMKV